MRSARSGAALSFAWISVPSVEKAASGYFSPAINRRTRSLNDRLGPAGSAATTSTPYCAPSEMREHRHSSARPKPAPKPRNFSSRGAASCFNVGLRRAICVAAICEASKRFCRTAATLSPPKIAAPTAFANRIRSPSALQSQPADCPRRAEQSARRAGTRKKIPFDPSDQSTQPRHSAEPIEFTEVLIVFGSGAVHAAGRHRCR